jgi:hypothetical protein
MNARLAAVLKRLPGPLIVGTIACLYLFWTWTSELVGLGGDNAYYVLTARYFSPYSPTSEVPHYFATHNQYPPLYPLLLGLSGGADNLLVAHVVTTLFLLAAFGLLYWYARLLGATVAAAGALIVAFAALPGTYTQALYLHSENLFLMFTLLALALTMTGEVTRCTHYFLLAAVAIAATALTRSAGITLLGAWLIYLPLRRIPDWPKWVVAATAPVLLWGIFSSHEGPHYLTLFTTTFQSDIFAELYAHIRIEVAALIYGWLDNISQGGDHTPLIETVIGMVCLAGAWARLRTGELDGWYALLYLLMILIWPFPAEAQRLVFAIQPILLAQGVRLLSRLTFAVTRGSRRTLIAGLLPVTLLLMAAPDLALTIQRFRAEMPVELESFRRSPEWYGDTIANNTRRARFSHDLINNLRAVPQFVPKNECIFAIKPSIVGLYTERVALNPPRETQDDRAFWSEIKMANCHYVYFMNFTSPSFPSFYPYNRVQASLRIVKVFQMQDAPSFVTSMLGRLVLPENSDHALP